MYLHRTALTAAAVALSCAGAVAGPVTEMETNGTASNNTPMSAQFIGAGAFTLNTSPDVFGAFPTATISGRGGGSDVDFFAFLAPAGRAYFDIDGAGFDSYLALLDTGGTLLADADDSFPSDPGSGSDLDAFLGVVDLPAPGVYFIAVSRSGNAAAATFTGTMFDELFRPDGAFGGFAFRDATPGDSSFPDSGPQAGLAYTLHVSVPGPATPLIGLGAMLIAAHRRRV